MTPTATHASLPRTLRAVLAVCLVALAAGIAAPGAAHARGGEVSIMDDQLLLNATPAEIDADMARFSAMGIDRLRVSAFWNQIAPDPLSREKPSGFDGADSNDPRYAFEPLDRVIAGAAEHGLRVMVTISMPAPIWATGASKKPNPLWKPNPAEFAAFTSAVVSRYAPLVDHYGISNEPNQGNWLQPQTDKRGRPVSPHLYRALVLAAYPRIKALDPSAVALVGELAASGRDGKGATVNMRPLRFLRALTCRSKRYRPVRGGRCKGFQPIPADAIGHHPYQLLLSPRRHSDNRDDAAINDGRRLIRVIDRLTRLGAIEPGDGRRKLNIFYTEFGYQTSPPDPFAGISLSKQRRYLQQAAYLVWRTPRIRGLNQFRLTDGALEGFGPNRFKEFQSGLLFRNRKPKPAFRIFRHPFVITGDRFWGQVRPGGAHTVRVEYRRRSKGKFRLVAQVLTDRRGYFNFRLPGRKPGKYRYRYEEPAGTSGVLTVRR